MSFGPICVADADYRRRSQQAFPMRTRFILPIILCALLGACATSNEGCSGREHNDEAASCIVASGEYTRTPAPGAPGRVVPVQIDSAFTLYERAKILRAVNEWNHVLNGFVRLDISPESVDASAAVAAGRSARSDGWIVGKITSRHPMLANMKQALAVTIGTRKAVVLVVADRLGSRDLGGIVMHELGHALGAGHDPGGKLMHPYYTGDKQRCIDKGAVRAVATAQKLPLNGLNWCGGEQAQRH
jgi:hypothetical protein